MAQPNPSRFSRVARESTLTPHQRTQSLSNAVDLSSYGVMDTALPQAWATGGNNASGNVFDPVTVSNGNNGAMSTLGMNRSGPADSSSSGGSAGGTAGFAFVGSGMAGASGVSGNSSSQLGRHGSLPPGTNIPAYLAAMGGQNSTGNIALDHNSKAKNPSWGVPPLPSSPAGMSPAGFGSSSLGPRGASMGQGNTGGGLPGWSRGRLGAAGGNANAATTLQQHVAMQQQQQQQQASGLSPGFMNSADGVAGLAGGGGGGLASMNPAAFASLAAQLGGAGLDSDNLSRTTSAPPGGILAALGDVAELERLYRTLNEVASPEPSPRVEIAQRQLSLAAQLGSLVPGSAGSSAATSPDNRSPMGMMGGMMSGMAGMGSHMRGMGGGSMAMGMGGGGISMGGGGIGMGGGVGLAGSMGLGPGGGGMMGGGVGVGGGGGMHGSSGLRPTSLAAMVRARTNLSRTSSCPPLGDEVDEAAAAAAAVMGGDGDSGMDGMPSHDSDGDLRSQGEAGMEAGKARKRQRGVAAAAAAAVAAAAAANGGGGAVGGFSSGLANIGMGVGGNLTGIVSGGVGGEREAQRMGRRRDAEN